jgi:hypothetical protein
LYRLTYARDYFALRKSDDARRHRFRERALPVLTLPDDAADWKHHCLRMFYEAARLHKFWSPGEKEKVLTDVHSFLVNADGEGIADDAIELNYAALGRYSLIVIVA